FRSRECVLVLGHLRCDSPKDALHDQTLRALAGPDRGAIATAIERVAVGRQREAALALLRAMAFETLGFEKRADLTLEINPGRRGARLRCLAARRADRRHPEDGCQRAQWPRRSRHGAHPCAPL